MLTYIFSRGKYLFLFSLFDKLINLLFLLVLARELSLDNYGIFTTVFSLSILVLGMLDFGFSNYLQRELKIGENNIDIINNVLFVRIIVVVVYVLIIFLYFSKLIFSNYLVFGVVLYSIALNISSLISSVYLGVENYKFFFKYSIFVKSFILISAGYIFYQSNVVASIIIASMCTILVSIMALYQFFINSNFDFKFVLKYSIAKNILIISIPMGLSVSFVKIYDKIDILLLEHFLSLKDVAEYAIAYSYYKLPYFVITSLLTPTFIKFSKKFAEFNYISKRSFYHVQILVGSIALLFILFSLFFCEILIQFIWGDNYITVAKYAIILVLALPGLFFNNLSGITLNASNNQNKALYAAIYSTLINIAFNLFLIPYIGIWGAVISTVITEYGSYLYQFYKIHKLDILK